MRFFPFVPLRVRMTVSVVLCLPDPYHEKGNAYTKITTKIKPLEILKILLDNLFNE
jgi:hypothetical protein